MAGIKGINYAMYRKREDVAKRKHKLRPWVVVLLRIIILPLTLPIRLYRWVYYD